MDLNINNQPIEINDGLFVLIIGPSGVGKGTIVNKLKERFKDAVFVKSMTTRAKRPGEKDGDQYYFVSKNEFEKGIAEGKFLEWALVHQKDYYGILVDPVKQFLGENRLVIREVDVQGFAQIIKRIPKKVLLTIFIQPESIEVLRNRIQHRGELPVEEMQRRMESVKHEMEMASQCDYRVTNYEGRLLQCFLDVEGIIKTKAASRGMILE